MLSFPLISWFAHCRADNGLWQLKRFVACSRVFSVAHSRCARVGSFTSYRSLCCHRVQASEVGSSAILCSRGAQSGIDPNCWAALGRFFNFYFHTFNTNSVMVDQLSHFLFQPVLHDWCNKGCGVCYPVCGMMHINEPVLLIGTSSLCGGSGFPLSLSEWSFTVCLTPYNHN